MPNSATPRRLAVLASGRGSTFAAILAAIKAGQINARVLSLWSNKPESGAVAIARQHGIATWAQSPKNFASRADFDTALFGELERVQPELILCAGYLRIIGAEFVERWTGRMINLHPSLLPAYPGLHTHARVLADGVAEHGASVHFVSAELDGGPLIAQVRIAVLADDSVEVLTERLRPREHALLSAVTAAICTADLEYNNGAVRFCGKALRVPLCLDACNQLRVADQ